VPSSSYSTLTKMGLPTRLLYGGMAQLPTGPAVLILRENFYN